MPDPRGVLAALIALVAASAVARAQTSLPPFDLKWRTFEGTLGDSRRATVTGPNLSWGDVRLSADQMEYTAFDPARLAFGARGNVRLTRGDEILTAATFTFDPDTASGVAEDAVLVSPPYYIRAKRIERSANTIRARDAVLTPDPEGRGEVRIASSDIRWTENKSIRIRRPTLYLFGTRLITLPTFRRSLVPGESTDRLSLPIRLRRTQTSGTVIGVALPFTVTGGTTGSAAVDFPTQRTGVQILAQVNRELLGDPPPRRAFEPIAAPATPPSPLRQFLTARPLPPAPDPIRDFRDILPTPNTAVWNADAGLRRGLSASAFLETNREFTGRRRTPLLLTRAPELRLSARAAPAQEIEPPTEAAALRRFLRRPRPLYTIDMSLGRFSEREIAADQRSTTVNRSSVTLGGGLLPLLVGARTLIRPRASATEYRYGGGGTGKSSFRVAEVEFNVEHILGPRTGIGYSYFQRFSSGTPALSLDTIDARSEARFRAQTGIGRVTVAGLARQDVESGHFFDFELAAAVRLRTIEPKISYRRLGKQFGIGLNLLF